MFGLEATKFVSLPGIAFNAALKKTKVELDLLSDNDQYLFINSSIKGGVTQICKKYSEANNKYMKKNFNPSLPSKYLWYIDANSMYAGAMVESLPQSNFQWMSPEKLAEVKENLLAGKFHLDDDPEGYFLEASFYVPDDKHDLMNDLPLAAEPLMVDSDLVSPETQRVAECLNETCLRAKKN